MSRLPRVTAVIETQLGQAFQKLLPQYSLQVSVTRVVLSRDLRQAKVWLDIEADDPKKILRKIQQQQKHLRHELAQNIVMQNCPELDFRRDENPDYVRYMDELFEKIKINPK